MTHLVIRAGNDQLGLSYAFNFKILSHAQSFNRFTLALCGSADVDSGTAGRCAVIRRAWATNVCLEIVILHPFYFSLRFTGTFLATIFYTLYLSFGLCNGFIDPSCERWTVTRHVYVSIFSVMCPEVISVELTPHHSSLQDPDSFLLTHIPTLSCSVLSCLSKFSDIVEPVFVFSKQSV